MTHWRECPFCGAELGFWEWETRPDRAAWFHPGTITDGECILSGKGFYPYQRELWNRREGKDG